MGWDLFIKFPSETKNSEQKRIDDNISNKLLIGIDAYNFNHKKNNNNNFHYFLLDLHIHQWIIGKCSIGYTSESSIYIVIFLGRCLEIWYIPFGNAPFSSCFLRDLWNLYLYTILGNTKSRSFWIINPHLQHGCFHRLCRLCSRLARRGMSQGMQDQSECIFSRKICSKILTK